MYKIFHSIKFSTQEDISIPGEGRKEERKLKRKRKEFHEKKLLN